ncbi:MAG: Smr/MutS family protein [Alphaproteobacteria bacterium]|nr:Smr/MutS family protein [Alphaproteobacteria bacterium]
MKPPRRLTPEELALWHEANRLTTPHAASPAPDSAPPPVPATAPSPRPNTATPRPTARAASPLPALSAREAAKRFKPHPTIEATLDLHGLDKITAYAQVQQFIARAAAAGRRHVLIITGKGRGPEAGILRANLPHWLNEPVLRRLISAFRQARPEKGGDGVTHVLLKGR